MSEKAKILGSSTYGAEELPIETSAQVENQISDTVVNEQVNSETETQTTNTENNETTTQEDNSSSFELSLGEDNSTITNNKQEQIQTNSSWKDILKKLSPQERNEAAKELGFDDFDINFSDARKRGVEPSKYIYSKAIDWSKVNDIDLLKNDYRAKFPNATPIQIDKLIAKQYNQTEIADEEDRELGALMMQADAQKIREQKINESNSFQLPERIEPQKDEAYSQWKEQQETINRGRQGFNQFLAEHEATKNLLQNKRVAIPIGKDGRVFNINIDKPELINTVLTDGGKSWNKLVTTQDGKPDIAKQQMGVLFMANPQKFIDDIYNYGVSQGKKSIINGNTNATREIGTQPRGSVVNMTEREAFSKNARSSTYGSQ